MEALNCRPPAPGTGAARPLALQRASLRRRRASVVPAAAGGAGPREVAVIGGEDYILSQASGVKEELFKGDVLGVDADIARTTFRETRLRSLSHLPEGLEPPPRLLQRVAVHYARNLLAGTGAIPGQVPLLLGIWGPKGAGKSFGLELCLRKMGVTPVFLSAGELEDEWAGEPGRRLRERYSFAARHAASTGEGTCLIISDMDAGVGTYEGIQSTVNNQILQGSLMALCDDPSTVSTGQEWAAVRRAAPRVPIYVTANDLGCLYAPLVRDGRMDKLFWAPTRGEMVGMMAHLFAPDLAAEEVEVVVDTFPNQPIDFFGAIKSRLADGAVREWLESEGGSSSLAALVQQAAGAGSAYGLGPNLQLRRRATLAEVLAAGRELAGEQQAVMDIQLSKEYMPGVDNSPEGAEAYRKRWQRGRRRPKPQRREVDASASMAAQQAALDRAQASGGDLSGYWASMAQNSWVSSSLPTIEEEEEQGERPRQEGERGAAAAAAEATGEAAAGDGASTNSSSSASSRSGDATVWPPELTPDEVAALLRTKGATVLDVRSSRDWEWGKIKGAVHAPFVKTSGSSLNPVVTPDPAGFLAAAAAKVPSKARQVVLYGPGRAPTAEEGAVFVSKEMFVSLAPTAGGADESIVATAAEALRDAGYTSISVLQGGYRAWDLEYRPDGRRRTKGSYRDKSSGELEWWTASN